MQIVFMPGHGPGDYADKNGAGKYPDAPGKCPHKGCGINTAMRKNGFYRRYLKTAAFSGFIRIRRYKCPKCGRTVSMLPSFCLSGFSYGVELVISMVHTAAETGSVRKAMKEWGGCADCVTRRQIALYLARIRENRKLIQYGLNQISPENVNIGNTPGDIEWAKRFLLGIRPTLAAEFNADFHKATGKSFMSPKKMIA
jgi:hypothetical protein